VYELIPAYGGRLFRVDQHLQRLEYNLRAIGLKNPMTRKKWADVLGRLVGENNAADSYLYIQLTRGAAPRDHSYPASVAPTVFAYAEALQPIDPKHLETGVAAVTTVDIRWQRCDIKSIALLANVMSRQLAYEQGTMEAILVRDEVVTEGAASNIFIVEGETLKTPPKDRKILPGITRDLVLELAERNQVSYAEITFTETELLAADEVWMTSSTKEILPITRVNNRMIGDGKPGPMFAFLYRIYQDYKKDFRAGKVR